MQEDFTFKQTMEGPITPPPQRLKALARLILSQGCTIDPGVLLSYVKERPLGKAKGKCWQVAMAKRIARLEGHFITPGVEQVFNYPDPMAGRGRLYSGVANKFMVMLTETNKPVGAYDIGKTMAKNTQPLEHKPLRDIPTALTKLTLREDFLTFYDARLDYLDISQLCHRARDPKLTPHARQDDFIEICFKVARPYDTPLYFDPLLIELAADGDAHLKIQKPKRGEEYLMAFNRGSIFIIRPYRQ